MAYTTINKSTDHFNIITYSGNGSNPRTLTGVGFQPDWVWQKNRTDSNGHTLADAVRGANKTLSSDGNGAEVTDKDDGHLDAFTSDGFTVGAGSSSDARVNDGSHTYVAWNWKAATAFSNSAGTNGASLASTGRVNTTAGFSIVSYTGNATSGATIAHGLGAVPKMIIVKNRDNGTGNQNWTVYHKTITGNGAMFLDLTNTKDANAKYFNNATPTSSVFTVGDNLGTNGSGDNMIAYCFAEKTGYSKIGTYVGNGNADGAFIYTGFRPEFSIIKPIATQNWQIHDTKRDGYNVKNDNLAPNNTAAEADNQFMDIVSNGFKLRSSTYSASSTTYIYIAFGQSLVGSNNVPNIAR